MCLFCIVLYLFLFLFCKFPFDDLLVANISFSVSFVSAGWSFVWVCFYIICLIFYLRVINHGKVENVSALFCVDALFPFFFSLKLADK